MLQRYFRLHLVVRIAGRNREIGGGRRECYDALLGSLISEDYAYARAVRPRLAVGRVMKLENEIGASLDQFALPRFEHRRHHARRIASQRVAETAASATLATIPLRNEGNPRLRSF